jgi:hypothetical protein
MEEKKILIPILDKYLVNPNVYREKFGERQMHERETRALLLKSFRLSTKAIKRIILEDPKPHVGCIVLNSFNGSGFKYAALLIVSFEKSFYDKHLGKLIAEARRRELKRINSEITKELSNVDWVKTINEAKNGESD